MKILAVDTSASVASVAVMEDGVLLGEYSINNKKTHSQKLLPMINELLKNLDISVKEMDYFAASSGPGSFTGLRIGITTIKTLAYSADKPVIAVPTLDALANNVAPSEALVCPMMDARNSQVYTALYTAEKGAVQNITEYMGIHITELCNILNGKNKRVILLGDGVAIHKAFINESLKVSFDFAPASSILQRAASVAEVAMQMLVDKRQQSSFDMVPFYLRKSQAERMFEAENKKG
jgi:universal bacterial protein YeaZ